MSTSRGGFSREERKLFALYARYPEISFDSTKQKMDQEPASDSNTFEHPPDLIPDDDDGSSSTSLRSAVTAFERDEADATDLSGTTLRRTSWGDDGDVIIDDYIFRRLGTAEDEGTLEYYLRLVEIESDWPELRAAFTWFGKTIASIGQDMFPIDPDRPLPHIDDTYALCRDLLRELICANLDIIAQREKIAYVKTLRPFHIDPPDEYVWTVFKQRAELIAEHTSLPRASEIELIDGLLVLFHIQMHSPYMEFIEDEDEVEARFKRIFASILNKLTSWLLLYEEWRKDMVDLKRNYTIPLWNRIRSSAEVRAEIREESDAQNGIYAELGDWSLSLAQVD